MILPDVEIAVLGDLHGCFSLAEDLPLLAPHALRLCTGDLAPNGGASRFDEALRQARDLRECGVHVILGNHDGPTPFTGRSFPKSYVKLADELGEWHVALRRVERPDLGVTLVGARPLTFGGGEANDKLRRYAAPGHEEWRHAEWADAIATLLEQAEQPRVVVLAHDGPTGLGARRTDIYGCDFMPEEGDWGDADLRMALDRARERGVPVVAVVAGHMHHALQGGGERTRAVREGAVLHLNAALVPRVQRRGRALFVLRLEGAHATARLEWHAPDGTVETEQVA